MFSSRASKILRCFFVQRKFCVAFSCKKKNLGVFLLYNVRNNFFRSSVSAMKTSMKVLSIESAVRFSQIVTKQLFNDRQKQLNACAFSDGVEKQKCCLGPGDIKTVITFFLYNFLIQNLAGCFVTAIATVSVIFTFFRLLE